MAKADSLTAARLRELLHYDPLTGVFTRRIRTSNSVQIGDVAGSVRPDGYVRIKVDGRDYLAHRMAWLYMTGDWPPHGVDHKNTTRHDNLWGNLRLATDAQNQQNRRFAQSNNKSGLLGVSVHGNRWMARIVIRGNQMVIGSFGTKEMAHAAYLESKAVLHPFQTICDADLK